MTEEITKRVQRVLIEQLGVEESQVSPTAKLVEDLDCDSLSLVECVLAIEEEFEVDVPDDEASAVQTVGDVVGLVYRLKNQSN